MTTKPAKTITEAMSLLDFKRRIASEVRNKGTDSWQVVDSILRSSLER